MVVREGEVPAPFAGIGGISGTYADNRARRGYVVVKPGFMAPRLHRHEIGHALGFFEHDEPPGLMCDVAGCGGAVTAREGSMMFYLYTLPTAHAWPRTARGRSSSGRSGRSSSSSTLAAAAAAAPDPRESAPARAGRPRRARSSAAPGSRRGGPRARARAPARRTRRPPPARRRPSAARARRLARGCALSGSWRHGSAKAAIASFFRPHRGRARCRGWTRRPPGAAAGASSPATAAPPSSLRSARVRASASAYRASACCGSARTAASSRGTARATSFFLRYAIPDRSVA